AANRPPTVTAKSPAPGSTGVSRTASVTATFSRAMDTASLASGFTLTASGASSPVGASVTYNGTTNVSTLTPTVPLDPGATYTAKLDTTVRASDGAPLASAVTWTFTTGACPCTLLPATSSPTQTVLDVTDGR